MRWIALSLVLLAGCSAKPNPAPSTTDAGSMDGGGGDDAGSPDAGPDAGAIDAGMIDAGPGAQDGGEDAGPADGGLDAGAIDAGPGAQDGGNDAGSPDAGPIRVKVTGSAAKGPLIIGSSITVSPIDDAGTPLGQSFPTTTTDDLGNFGLELTYQGPVLMQANGFYYNEITGAVSGAAITLQGYANVGASGTQNVYINAVTHLASGRVLSLLGQGVGLQDAIEQADADLFAAIAVGGAGIDPGTDASQFNFFGGANQANAAYLFAVGAVFAEAAELSHISGSEDAKLQTLMNTVSSDLSTSTTLPTSTTMLLGEAQQRIEPRAVTQQLSAYVASLDSNVPIPDIDLALDSDLDGIPNAQDNCPLVPNAAQQPVNDDICDFELLQYGEVPDAGMKTSVRDAGDSSNDSPTLFAFAGAMTGGDVQDLIFVGGEQGDFEVWLNDGGGSLSPGPTTMPGIIWPLADDFQLTDINRDGIPDIAFSYQYDSETAINYAPGEPGGTFGAIQTAISSETEQIGTVFLVADVNGDRISDIVTTQAGGCVATGQIGDNGPMIVSCVQLRVAAGEADGGYAPPSTVSAQGRGEGVVLVDLNGDGAPDAVVASLQADSSSVLTPFLNDGSGTFTAGTPFALAGSLAYCGQGYLEPPRQPVVMATGDVDGDGVVDLVVGTTSAGSMGEILVFYPDGSGMLPAPVVTDTGRTVSSSGSCAPGVLLLAVADMTGDGKADVMVSGNEIWVSAGRTLQPPAGTYAAAVIEGLPQMYSADLNGDGISDLYSAAASETGGDIVLMSPSGWHSW